MLGGGGQDVTCLEPQVCFFFPPMFFFGTKMYLIIDYSHEWSCRSREGGRKGLKMCHDTSQATHMFFFLICFSILRCIY